MLDPDAVLYRELPQYQTMAAHFVFAATPHREVGVSWDVILPVEKEP